MFLKNKTGDDIDFDWGRFKHRLPAGQVTDVPDRIAVKILSRFDPEKVSLVAAPDLEPVAEEKTKKRSAKK